MSGAAVSSLRENRVAVLGLVIMPYCFGKKNICTLYMQWLQRLSRWGPAPRERHPTPKSPSAAPHRPRPLYFFSKAVDDLHSCATKHKLSTSNRPQTKGLTERLNRTLTYMFHVCLCWPSRLGDYRLLCVTFAFNSYIPTIPLDSLHFFYFLRPRA